MKVTNITAIYGMDGELLEDSFNSKEGEGNNIA